MKKEYKYIVIGLVTTIILSTVLFLSLNKYMDIQTEKDIRAIANVHLMGMASEELNRFDAVKQIRFSQVDSMLEEVNELGENAGYEEIQETISRYGEFQDVASCVLIDKEGDLDTVYGVKLEKLGDPDFLLKSMNDKVDVVTGGWDSQQQVIIYAAPISLPMKNGKKSIGLLWCKTMSSFSDIMNLNSADNLVYFHIIRRDATYVINSYDSSDNDFFEKLKKHAVPEEMDIDRALEGFKAAIEENSDFSMNTTYIDEFKNIHQRRSMYATPLPDSNWYLVSVIPYGVLDQMIEAMGVSRTGGMFLAIGILAVYLLILFYLYMRMTRKQVDALSLAREEAEAAMEEAKASEEEAIESRNIAQDATAEAEAASEEAVKARKTAEEAMEAAESANKAKSEFLSNMSHDIRTPMNAIIGMTTIATDHIDDKERVADCLKKITLSGKHLLGLINDVLDMSKIESGKMVLNMEALSLKETMETMCEIIRPQIKAGGQNFDVYISNIIAENVYCDGVRLNQVLLNFLSNAVKFTPEGGSIFVKLYQESSLKGINFVRTHLVISDTGMGMTKEFQEKLFTAFEREDNTRVRKTQGTGLGMTISKYIVDAMGGKIEVESEAGVGTTFHVIVDFEKANEHKGEMTLPDWRILLVDDDEDLCKTVKISLEELGTRPDYCLSGKSAVEKIRQACEKKDKYFVILIDYKMEGMNGVETAAKIKEILGSDTPISLISAYDWGDIEDEAKQAGINGFIPKPLFKSTLYLELRKLDDQRKDNEVELDTKEQIDISGMKVLLAEDNDINAEIAKMILEENGVETDRAEDGVIVVDLFKASEEYHYDAILMDLRMPHMNGIEATEKIRSLKRADAGSIPIIAMTADAFAEDAQKCYAAGMNAHLAKPIDVELLKKTLLKYRHQ
ncbi:MAG: response regulator [Lachnospiraceae bacterium]|nr:response regulator [Lachnospiraceae bacterium]